MGERAWGGCGGACERTCFAAGVDAAVLGFAPPSTRTLRRAISPVSAVLLGFRFGLGLGFGFGFGLGLGFGLGFGLGLG